MLRSYLARPGTWKQLHCCTLAVVSLAALFLLVQPNTAAASSSLPPTTRPRKTTIKHLNKHVDLLNNAIGEEQEIERQNADELCTSNLHTPVTIKYLPEVDSDKYLGNSTVLPILDGCNVNSTCSLSNKNRQQEYAAMKLCLTDSTSKLQVYGPNRSSTAARNINILRLQEKIKGVEEKIRLTSSKRLKERQHSLQHLENHNNALHTIKHLQAYVVDKLNDMVENKDTGVPTSLTSFLDINEDAASSLKSIIQISTLPQKLKAQYTTNLMELKHHVERLPHRHTSFKRHKKRVNKLKIILHKLSEAIKRSRDLEKQRQKLLENDWKFLKNELVEEKREHQNNIDHLLTKNDRLQESEMKAKRELCLQNLKVLSIKTKKDALNCIEQYNEYVQNSKERELEMQQTNEIQSYSDQHIEVGH